MRTGKLWVLAVTGIGSTFSGCSGGSGSSGGSLDDLVGDGGLRGQLVVEAADEAPGGNCAAGGVALRRGVDQDGDGALSKSEVQSTQYVCNGVEPEPSPAQLVMTSTLEVGDANCPEGGAVVAQGEDSNGNGMLDSAEVTGTSYACNGVPADQALACVFPSEWNAATQACVPRADWAGENLSGQSFQSTYLAGVNMSGADLSGADLSWTDLRGANLSGANLTGADLSNASVRTTDFSGAQLDGSNLAGVDLSSATLHDVSASGLASCPQDLPNGWSCVDLGATGKTLLGPGASLSGLDLTGANLGGQYLGGAQITGLLGCPAQLPPGWQCLDLGPAGTTLVGRGANLSGLDLTGAVFSSITDLRNVDFSESVLTNAVFATNSNFDGATFTGASLDGVNLSQAHLNEASATNLAACPASLPTNWTCQDLPHTGKTLLGPGVDLSNLDLSGANLSGLVVTGANLEGTNLSGANLTGTTLSDVSLRDANFSGATLDAANLSFANLRDANLTGASMVGANLNNASLEQATLTGSTAYALVNCPVHLPEKWVCVKKTLVGPGASLAGVDLSSANLQDVNLAGADLSFANLGSSDFSNATATNVNFSGANLTSSDFSDANLAGALLTSATLTGVQWDNTICPNGVKSNNNGGKCP